MSRIGRNPVPIPTGVTATLEADRLLIVKGPKGELRLNFHPLVNVNISETEIAVTRDGEEKEKRALHGLTRNLIRNMVDGVTKGYTKRLEINGVGYRANVQGNKLNLSLGYSHPVEYTIPEGIQIAMDVEKKNVIIVTGIDKQQVGQVAAEIRAYRKPEPYKGKGIRYENEYVRRKAGKTAAK